MRKLIPVCLMLALAAGAQAQQVHFFMNPDFQQTNLTVNPNFSVEIRVTISGFDTDTDGDSRINGVELASVFLQYDDTSMFFAGGTNNATSILNVTPLTPWVIGSTYLVSPAELEPGVVRQSCGAFRDHPFVFTGSNGVPNGTYLLATLNFVSTAPNIPLLADNLTFIQGDTGAARSGVNSCLDGLDVAKTFDDARVEILPSIPPPLTPSPPQMPSPTPSPDPSPTPTVTAIFSKGPAEGMPPSPTPDATPTPGAACCPGDANNSGGVVNANDFLAVQNSFGADTGPGGTGDADCSGGNVNANDFLTVQASFGVDCGPSTAPSPTPGPSPTPDPNPTSTPAPTTTPTPIAPTPTAPGCCPGDANNSGGFVNAQDRLAVQAHFGQSNGLDGLGDADCSAGRVNYRDFISACVNFGLSCP